MPDDFFDVDITDRDGNASQARVQADSVEALGNDCYRIAAEATRRARTCVILVDAEKEGQNTFRISRWEQVRAE